MNTRSSGSVSAFVGSLVVISLEFAAGTAGWAQTPPPVEPPTPAEQPKIVEPTEPSSAAPAPAPTPAAAPTPAEPGPTPTPPVEPSPPPPPPVEPGPTPSPVGPAPAPPSPVEPTPTSPPFTPTPALHVELPIGVTPATLVFGDGLQLFAGMNPASIGEDSGMTAGGTGATNIAHRSQGYLGLFGGAAWDHFVLDPGQDWRVNVRGEVVLGGGTDRLNAPAGKQKSYDTTLSLDRGDGEYLRYVSEAVGQPLFVGGWGSITGATLGYSRSASTGFLETRQIKVPLRASVGAGIGRIVPAQSRITLERMEQALQREGALTADIPPAIAEQIFAAWYRDRDHLRLIDDPQYPYGASSQRQILTALQILHDAGLLTRPIHLLAAYGLGRIITDPQQLDRFAGHELRAGVRLALSVDRLKQNGVDNNNDLSPALALEVRGRSYFNLTADSDLRFDPSLSIAPRVADVPANDLTGARRVALGPPPGAGTVTPFMPTGRLLLDVPVSYQRFLYDPAYNATGRWNIHVAASAGYGPTGATPAKDAVGVAMAAGAAYTSYSERRTGMTVGLNLGLGYFDALLYTVGLVFVVDYGTGDTTYTAPDQVGDLVPFDTNWLPRPTAESIGSSP
jgi:hypothetical protein